MIAVSSSGKGFRALAAYLATGRTGTEQARVAWSTSRNLPTDDPQLAATLMRATAAQNVRVEKPVYHVAIAFDPGDPVDRATMERVADRVLVRLGLTEHQAVIVAHQDREHPHLHILVNRVHPETGKAWDRWQDQPVVQQILREEERALGLRVVPGRLYAMPDELAVGGQMRRSAERPAMVRAMGGQRVVVDGSSRTETTASEVAPALSAGERRTWDRTGETPLLLRARAHLAAVREASTWKDVQAVLTDAGMRFERRGPGLVVTDGERYVKASRVAPDLALGRLEQRLSASFPAPVHTGQVVDKTPIIRRAAPGEVALAPDKQKGAQVGAHDVSACAEQLPIVPLFAPEISLPLAGLVREIGVYEERLALVGRQLEAQLGASAARARASHLDTTAARVDAAESALRQSFARAFREPAAAERAYEAHARAAGRADAVRILRDRPEWYGRLTSIDVTRALGIGTRGDDREGRAAAVVAAGHAARVAEARRELARLVVSARVQRYEATFTRRLARLYVDAPAARERFGAMVLNQGLKRAVTRLTRDPGELGELRPRALARQERRERSMSEDERGRERPSGDRQVMAHVQHAFRDALRAGGAWALVGRDATMVIDRLDTTEGALRAALERERSGAGRLGERAANRERRIGTELARIPARAGLERAIGQAVRRLVPVDIRELEGLLTNPQRALLAKLKGQVRQAILGRELGE